MKRINPFVAFALNTLLDHLEQQQEQASLPAPDFPELGDLQTVQQLKRKEGAVVVILGRRETGKTVLSHRLAEILGRPTYAVSPEQASPKGITDLAFEELDEQPPPWTTLILDDVPVFMSSRDYHNPAVRVVEKIIPVVRHKRKIVLIFCTQSSSMSDRYILDADVVFLKPASLMYVDLERSGVLKVYKEIMPTYDEMTEFQRKQMIYVFTHDWKGWATVHLPTFYE